MNFELLTSVPGYLNYFDEDTKLIIRLIGVEKYFKLLERFGKTNVYISEHTANSDMQELKSLLGQEHYTTLCKHFSKTSISFNLSKINDLKRVWLLYNEHIHYAEAARTLNVATKTIYIWRKESRQKRKTNNLVTA
jgi:hypothetical protein